MITLSEKLCVYDFISAKFEARTWLVSTVSRSSGTGEDLVRATKKIYKQMQPSSERNQHYYYFSLYVFWRGRGEKVYA